MYVHTCWHILLKTIFNWRITALQYYVGFHHISALISYRCTHVPSLLNLPPTSNPTPLGCQRNLGFELLCHAANFHWLSDFTPGNACFSAPLSGFPTFFPRCVCKSLLCLHLHCCLSGWFITAILLGSICMCLSRYLSFSFWLTSLCIIGSGFFHLIRTDKCIPFYGWVILHWHVLFLNHEYVPVLLPCIDIL